MLKKEPAALEKGVLKQEPSTLEKGVLKQEPAALEKGVLKQEPAALEKGNLKQVQNGLVMIGTLTLSVCFSGFSQEAIFIKQSCLRFLVLS
ncbi:MAG: hypothetical protein H6605_04080 [Flavobacteriales bacterium]|nr:hypothetical protein [Flavobacteriales bacterium]